MRLDRNGYGPSILDTEQGTCYVCGLQTDTIRHEIYHGVGNRSISKANGFWVNLCPRCHRCHRFVHLRLDDGDLDSNLKRICYTVFCRTRSKAEFYDLIKRYYDE